MLDFYKGMDLSFVPQCMEEGQIFRDFDGAREERVLHPTEHSRQNFTVRLAVEKPGLLKAGLRIVSPPVYGILQDFKLIKERKEWDDDIRL